MSEHLKRKRTVVFLGGFMHEGVRASLTARGFHWQSYGLVRVSPRTWIQRTEKIKELRQNGELAGIVYYLPTPVILHASRDEFLEPWKELIKLGEDTHSVAFLYAENLSGEFRPKDMQTGKHLNMEDIEKRVSELSEWMSSSYWELAAKQVKRAESQKGGIARFLGELFASKIEIYPFWKRDDTTLRVDEFLEEIDQRVFLRLYISDDRFQADQIASFLKTFERYLRQIEGKQFSIETRKTSLGTIYVFRGEDPHMAIENLEHALGRFDEFMKLCRDDPNSAAKILNLPRVNSAEVPFLIAKYARDYQRIIVDSKHEMDRKSLLLAQRLELDLLNYAEDQIGPMVQNAGPSVLLNIAGNSGSINLNLKDVQLENAPQFSKIFGDVVNGGIEYNSYDKDIIRIIESLASRLEAVQLKSDLDQFKDQSTPPDVRKTATQRLGGFLYKVAGKAADTLAEKGTKVLIDYVMGTLGS